MFNKKVKKTNNNPYPNLRPADAQYFTKLDEKIALAQKQNKKEFCEFLIDKKQFDMNYINVKNNNKVGKLGLIPSSLLSILSARDNEKLFDNYKKDTMKIAKQLFDDDMTLQQICATACEFVRLSTANFDRYESETVQKPQSVLCQLLATNAYGLLSFYFGVSNAIDQTEFLAWLINMGLDIKHSLSYAECVIDAYGQPACHIVEFNGKLGVSYVNYVGIAKSYLKKIETLTGLCEFIDFTEEIENGRKRALKVLARYVPIKLMIKNRKIEDAIVSMSRIAYKNITDITATELNMLSIFDNKVWKFSSLCELLLYANGAEYEVIPDLFVETQYAFKLKLDNDGKFKIFPNKVIDEEYRLNEPKIYILNKTANKTPKQENISADDDLFNERIESIGRENKDVEFDNLEPMSADDVLNSLNVKFTPKENDGLTFENGTFKFNDDEMNDVFDLSNATQVDFNKAEEEQRMFEQAAGISAQAPQSEPPKRKGFFDLLSEMSEKTKKNKARRLQEEYERLERNHELNSHENLQGNSINQNQTLSQSKQNSGIENYDNDSVSGAISNSAQISTNNQSNYLENNDNYIDTYTNDDNFDKKENDDDINNDDDYMVNNNYLPSNDISEDLDYAEINNNNIVDFDNDVVENSKNTAENDNNVVDFSNYLDNNENMSSKFTDSNVANNDDALQNSNTLESSENYDEINAINSNFENIENVDEEIAGSNAAENDTNNFAEESIYGDIMQFSNYNYYDRTKDDDAENINEEIAEIDMENDNEISKSIIDDSNDKAIQSNIVEEQPQVKVAEEQSQKQALEKQIEAPKSVDKNDIEHLQNSKVDKQPIMEHPTEAPAQVVRKPVRAPQGFTPPIPKRKPAPPLPKRKK